MENKKEKKKGGKEKKNKRQKKKHFLQTILLSENDRIRYIINPFVSIRSYVRIFLSSSRPLRYHFFEMRLIIFITTHNSAIKISRLWAEVFHVSASGAGTVKWQQVSEDLVPVNITCIQDSPECIFHITAYNSQVDKILDVRLVQPGKMIMVFLSPPFFSSIYIGKEG